MMAAAAQASRGNKKFNWSEIESVSGVSVRRSPRMARNTPASKSDDGAGAASFRAAANSCFHFRSFIT
jgi:hypothetical protein